MRRRTDAGVITRRLGLLAGKRLCDCAGSRPQENITPLVDFMWEFMDMSPDNPDSWYRDPDADPTKARTTASGMCELYHHQTMWDNRQHPRVYGAFADIWETEKLWVSVDRVNLNPPAREDHDFQGFVHWDLDSTANPIPFKVQGVLALVDVEPEQGGLQVVPGFHNIFDEWVKTQPADRHPNRPNITGFDLVSPQMNAGDLVIWHSLLPHGTSRNNGTRPRMAQYIMMSPAQEENEALRQARIECGESASNHRIIAHSPVIRVNGKPRTLNPLN